MFKPVSVNKPSTRFVADRPGHVHRAVGLRKLLARILFTLSAVNCATTSAAEFQSLQSIRMQAEDFIHQFPYESPYPPRFDVSDLDPRLRLKTCPQPLAVEFARKEIIHGNTALKVSCPTTPGWKMLLPARIDLFDDVLVLTRAVSRGQFIDANLVKRQKRNISRLNNGYFSKINAIEGLESKRNLSRGDILTPASLTPKLMVKSGQQVTLILDYKGLTIRSTGKALQSARRGEVIKVRNDQSRRVVEGIVSGEAQVRINI